MTELTEEEKDEIHSQLLLVGQMIGMSYRINTPLLSKWLNSKMVDSDFKYEEPVRQAINFAKALRP